MAKVDAIRGGVVELLRGHIDFYRYKGIVPVARAWPQYKGRPWTELQAEAQSVFRLSRKLTSFVSPNLVAIWRQNTFGKRKQWPDDFTALTLQYWRKTRTLPLFLVDATITETDTEINFVGTMLQANLDPSIENSFTKYTMYPIKKEYVPQYNITKYYVYQNGQYARFGYSRETLAEQQLTKHYNLGWIYLNFTDDDGNLYTAPYIPIIKKRVLFQ